MFVDSRSETAFSRRLQRRAGIPHLMGYHGTVPSSTEVLWHSRTIFLFGESPGTSSFLIIQISGWTASRTLFLMGARFIVRPFGRHIQVLRGLALFLVQPTVSHGLPDPQVPRCTACTLYGAVSTHFQA